MRHERVNFGFNTTLILDVLSYVLIRYKPNDELIKQKDKSRYDDNRKRLSSDIVDELIYVPHSASPGHSLS